MSRLTYRERRGDYHRRDSVGGAESLPVSGVQVARCIEYKHGRDSGCGVLSGPVSHVPRGEKDEDEKPQCEAYLNDSVPLPGKVEPRKRVEFLSPRDGVYEVARQEPAEGRREEADNG